MKIIKGSTLLVGQCGTTSSQLLSMHLRHKGIMNGSTSKYAILPVLSIMLLLIIGISVSLAYGSFLWRRKKNSVTKCQLYQYCCSRLGLSTSQCSANRVLIYYRCATSNRVLMYVCTNGSCYVPNFIL
jgi:hypothetical protein